MHNEVFSAADLVTDEQFVRWVKHPDPDSDRYWEHWLSAHPDKRPLLEEARETVQRIQFKIYPQAVEGSKAVWHRINATLAERERAERRPATRPLNPAWRNWQKMAAVFAGLLLLGALVQLAVYRNAAPEYRTDYGQTRRLTLPDGSVVVLNANSSLTVNRNWEESREVWLQGEAFFSVRKKKITGANQKTAPAKFVVHTRSADVQVLGTEFNVFDRRENTVVVLNSGVISLALPNETIAMQPGELVELSAARTKPVKRRVNPAAYSAWKNREWVLDNLSLKQVAVKIEETYGIPVVIERADAAELFVTGVLPTQNVEILLQSLAQSLNIEITREKDQIVIR